MIELITRMEHNYYIDFHCLSDALSMIEVTQTVGIKACGFDLGSLCNSCYKGATVWCSPHKREVSPAIVIVREECEDTTCGLAIRYQLSRKVIASLITWILAI